MLSREGSKLKFVTGPRPAQEHGENRAQNDNLMAEPENRPPPSRPDPNTDPPNFLFAGQIVTRGGNHLAVDGTVGGGGGCVIEATRPPSCDDVRLGHRA